MDGYRTRMHNHSQGRMKATYLAEKKKKKNEWAETTERLTMTPVDPIVHFLIRHAWHSGQHPLCVRWEVGGA